jgi:adenine-specific DNA-methyltransferase
LIKYIGSKRVLVPSLVGLANLLPKVSTVLDLFSGTSRVGKALKEADYRVTANDHTAYAYKLAQCYVESDKTKYEKKAGKLIQELNKLSGNPGYFTETFCTKSMFFQPKNGEKIDAIREYITNLFLDPITEAILLVSLMEAADRVDSTCGIQMAYLKAWASRSNKDLELRVPAMVSGPGKAWCLDAVDAAGQGKFDLVYIDPPYNQHSYAGNYHIWESLVKWDKPEVYGKAMKRIDVKDYHSDFNSKRRILQAFQDVIDQVQANYIMVSFSNEGHLGKATIVPILENKGETAWLDISYKRYVGSQIGVYNNLGQKVGQAGATHNHEYIFLVGPNAKNIVKEYKNI